MTERVTDAEVEAALVELCDRAQALRDYAGSMPTLTAHGEDTFLTAVGVIERIEKSIVRGRAALEAAAKVRGDKPATTIESLIDTHSMRPPPLSDDGQAWEDGARQGWEWAQTFA
jgi:hypothetical protein